MTSNKLNEKLNYILGPVAVRERTHQIYQLAKDGKTHFTLNENKLEEVCEFVLEVIKENYPDLKIPFHSRWGHFNVGNIDRLSPLNKKFENLTPFQKAKSKIDFVITSVLLDAGSGPDWKYKENDKTFNRSEGLAVASLYMFQEGAFSTDGSLSAQADALKNISASDIENYFQVNTGNPLVGTEGRAALLSKLGEVVGKNDLFPESRPGDILNYLGLDKKKTITAPEILQAVLVCFGEIWPSRINYEGFSLGDVWKYEGIKDKNTGDMANFVAFHKLSQWLTYSLIEPIMESGIEVTDVDKLTGLAEYRNGGLLIDSGLIELKDKNLMNEKHKPNSDLIIEWRALTVVYLDKIGAIIQEKLKMTPTELPLAKVLEGGTWWAGRKLAAKNRADKSPPLKLDSDGTVF